MILQKSIFNRVSEIIVCLIKDKYPNFEVGLKCILMVFPYLLLCSYMKTLCK